MGDEVRSPAPTDEQKSVAATGPVRKASDWVAAIFALGVLGASVQQLITRVQQDQGQFLIGVFALLIVVALGFLVKSIRSWVAPKSYLRTPSAFDIGHKYLLGRDTDVENLESRIKDAQLVWLVGESGAGKSVLLQLGLVPALQKSTEFFPVLMDHWGQDWELGPRECLCRAVNRSFEEGLDEDQRRRVGARHPVPADKVVDILRGMTLKVGRVPVLIFDQFDDYQTRHHDRFICGEQREVLDVEQLVAANAFWRDIEALLKQKAIRCLFVTRADMAWGLECVRFEVPKQYLLGRLGETYAQELLKGITDGSVIGSPERGWNSLKRRLLRDLGVNGWVLPIQMKLAFQGLRELKDLSTATYEREGSLSGLEALDVKRHVAQAARLVGWKDEDVLSLLLAMVVPEVKNKTQALKLSELVKCFPGDRQDEEKLRQVLEKLQDADLVRQGLDIDQPGDAVWQLYHDYLCGGVVELDRRSRRWQVRLEEALCSFEDAQGLWRKWRALLSPVAQLRFAYARLRRWLRFGQARRFVGLSTVRWVVNFWLIGLLAAGYIWWERSATLEAENLYYAIDFREPLGLYSLQGRDLAWRLGTARPRLKKDLFRFILSRETTAEPLASGLMYDYRSRPLMRATLGLDPENYLSLLPDIVDESCYRDPAPKLSDACLFLLQQLPASPRAERVKEDALVRILGLLEGATSAVQVAGLTRSLGVLRTRLSAEQVSATAERTLEMMARSQNLFNELELAAGLGELEERLRPEHLQEAGRGIIDAVNRTPDLDKDFWMGCDLGALGNRLAPEHGQEFARRLLATIEKSSNASTIATMIGCLSSIDKHVDVEDFVAATEHGFAISKPHSSSFWEDVLPAVRVFSRSGDDRRFAKLFEDALDVVEKEDGFVPAWGSHAVLLVLAKHSDPGSYREYFDRISGYSLEGKKSRGLSLPLMHALEMFGDRFEPEEAASVVDDSLAGIAQAQGDEGVGILCRVLEYGQKNLPLQRKPLVAEHVYDLVMNAGEPSRLGALSICLSAVAESLTAHQVGELDRYLVAKIYDTDEPDKLRDLASALASVSSEAISDHPRKLVDHILAATAKYQNLTQAERVFSGVYNVGKRLPDPEASYAFARLSRLARSRQSLYYCGNMSPLIRPGEDMQAVIDFLKSPTCAWARDRVIQGLGEIVGESFGSEVDGRFRADDWAFIQWAQQQGYNLEPPKAPQHSRFWQGLL